MIPPNLRVRRATVEDLDTLRTIWTSMRLPADELERRLKEFQVVEDLAKGEVLGAIGLEFFKQYALLHNEGFSDFSIADEARQLFWDRIQTLAANHGVFRIWTQENSPFWTRWGFQPVAPEILSRLPEQWKANGGQWFTLPLKDEDAVAAALENKFAGFMNDEKQQTDQLSQKARTFRILITVAGFVVFFICMAILLYWFMHGNLSLQ